MTQEVVARLSIGCVANSRGTVAFDASWGYTAVMPHVVVEAIGFTELICELSVPVFVIIEWDNEQVAVGVQWDHDF